MTEEIKPKSIRLETSTFCQLKCPSCETAQGKTHESLGGGFLKFKDFQNVVDENPWISHIELSNWGEIFLNPDLSEIMEYAYQKSVALTAANGTNLNTVKEAVLENLVKYRFRHLMCSIDGASQETYQQYRVGGNFERVLENIRIINHYKSLHRSKFPVLNWQFVIFGHNEHEIETVQRMAKELNMKVRFKLSWDESFSPVKNEELIKKVTSLDAASRSEYTRKHGTDYLQKGICGQLWKTPQINWDGKILGCCYNYWGDFGNAFESGLASGLNSEKLRYARQMLRGRVEAKDGIPCTSCGHYKRMKEKKRWLTPKDISLSLGKLQNLAYRSGRAGVWITNHSRLASQMYLSIFSR